MKSGGKGKYVLLIFGFIVLFMIALSMMFTSNGGSEGGIPVGNMKDASDKEAALNSFTFSLPERVYGSDISLISIEQQGHYSRAFSSGSSYERGTKANVLFFDLKAGYYHLLLSEKASINKMDYPESRADSLQKVIFYDISLKDTDGNGRINSEDESNYFISDLSGMNFKRIKLDGYVVVEHQFIDKYNYIYLLCAKDPRNKEIERENWERVLFEYDVKKDELLKLEDLNMLIGKAKQIMLK